MTFTLAQCTPWQRETRHDNTWVGHHGRGSISGREGAMFVYVGAYTEPPSGSADGIAVFRFDNGTGELHPVQTVPGVVNPSWLTLDGREQVLFAVNEEGEGRISAFARDAATGMLRPLNDQRSHGADPCYVSLDSSDRYVLVANYSGGTVAVLPVADD